MLKRTHLLALTGFAAIMIYTQGCATDDNKNNKPANSKQAQESGEIGDNRATQAPNIPASALPATQAAPSDKPADANQEADVKKLSEAFGHFIGRNLKSPGIDFDLDSIVKGMREGAAGIPAPISDKEYEELMAAFQEKSFKEMADKNLKAANEFVAKNAKEAGVVEIEPGKIQYIIVTQGKDPAVTEDSTPTIIYTGKYLDGTVFGSSDETGGPISIPLKQTIPGFSKGMIGMKEGEKRKVFVHPDLGYGTTGQLPPNELLIFDVEVVKADTPKSDIDAKLSAGEEDEFQNGSDVLAYEGESDSAGEEALEQDLSPAQSAASKEPNNPDNQLPAPHSSVNRD